MCFFGEIYLFFVYQIVILLCYYRIDKVEKGGEKVNANPNGQNNNGHDGIDLIDLSSGREMESIRRNEMIAKEQRRKRAAEIRRKEMLRRKRIAQIKRAIFAWCALIFTIIVIVAVIIGITSALGDDEKKTPPAVGNEVSESEMKLVTDFTDAQTVIVGDSSRTNTLGDMLVNMTAMSLDSENPVEHISELFLAADAYSWNAELDTADAVRNYVRDVPIFSNGYVFSSKQSMKSPVTDSYLYDTNSSFIIAVSEICLWDGSTVFLSQVDNTTDNSKDISKGMTVGEKLEAAVNYLFDTEDLNGGGLRFNTDDGLVYVLTSDNNGTSSGKPSNIFFNHRFGYLDAYNNILFNKAMQSLSHLYKMREDTEKSEMYASVAENNKKAINETFYNETLGRYSGCIDSENKVHDGGFTALNLAAIAYGIADEAKTDKILSWIDGKTKIATDSLDSTRIMETPALPAFSTVKATDSWWDYVDGEYPLSSDADFGKYWMNGGKSVIAGYFDLLAREKTSAKTLRDRLDNISAEYSEGRFALDGEDVKYPQPDLYYALTASNAVKKSFGISTDGKVLNIIPIFSWEKTSGIKNISFNSNRYGVLFDETGTYVIADANAAVKLRIGGFSANASVSLVVVEDGSVLSEETATADKDGTVVVVKRFGNNSYIKLLEIEK